jgi:hypothetical protein
VQEYIKQLEEAKKYDHRLVGTKQELFFCHPQVLYDLLFFVLPLTILSFAFRIMISHDNFLWMSVQEVGSSFRMGLGYTTN